MEGIQPTLQILPFDHNKKVCVRAKIVIPPQEQSHYVSKSFLMFVIEVRSAMDENDIGIIKRNILDMCDELISRNGISYIGFVINEQYITIRNPNYEGIKDLLNQRLNVVDTVDFQGTLVELRHAIRNQKQKMAQSKLSLFVFTSNVAQSQLNPVKKESWRKKLNEHLPNYYKEISRLKKTIKEICPDSHSYIIGYVKGCAEQSSMFDMHHFSTSSGVDMSLLYQMHSCTHQQKTFEIATSSKSMSSILSSMCSLMLYQFHQFSLMIPVDSKYRPQFTEQQKQLMSMENEEIMQEMEHEMQEQNKQMMDEEDFYKQISEELAYFLQEQHDEKQQKKQELDFEKKIKYISMTITNSDERTFNGPIMFLDRRQIELEELHKHGYHLVKKLQLKNQLKFPIKKKLRKVLQYQFRPQLTSKEVDYRQPTILEEIQFKSIYYSQQLNIVIQKMIANVLSYKRRYLGNRKYQYYLEINEPLQHRLRERVAYIELLAKQIMSNIFDTSIVKTQQQKRKMFEFYSSLKVKIDAANEALMQLLKKQIKNENMNKLCNALNYQKVKQSLRRKLIKRINGNPTLIDDTFQRVEQICQKINFVDVEAKYHVQKSLIGNCMYSLDNFAKAMRKRDCLGIVFEIQRPDAAIADPGRIRIRQVSTMVATVSKFFQIHQYGITQSWSSVNNRIPQMLHQQQANIHQKKQKKIQKIGHRKWQICSICFRHDCTILYAKYVKNNYLKDIRYILIDEKTDKLQQIRNAEKSPFLKYIFRNLMIQPEDPQQKQEEQEMKFFGINKKQYKQNWDYWNRVESKKTFYGIMPLYICEQNWKISKMFMKLCLGWTACSEPLGYSYSQYQTIPFMVLSSLIRAVQESKYKIAQIQKTIMECKIQQQFYTLQSQYNIEIHKRDRLENLFEFVEKTCQVIMTEQSSEKFEEKMSDKVAEKYKNYNDPLQRTVDIINNNSSFMGQLWTAFKLGYLKKPSEEEFHEFFKKLIEQQLRRQTDGWNEEQVEEKFENKLLNAKIQKMDKPQYVVMDSVYKDRFLQAQSGKEVLRTEFQIQRQNLQMMLKENNSFNDTQRMTIIQYKRLYENRVLWFWFIRFRLYQEIERIKIHKWKCLDLTNSYQLFTMIIQNKKQRKNARRRQAIMKGEYCNPFDYYQARGYLEKQYIRLRNKKQHNNIVLLNNEKYGHAATAFSQTRDLEEAAGALMNTNLNQQIVMFYEELFRDPKDIQQKLKMILNGEYGNVKLLKFGWSMSRKKTNLLRKKYPYEFQLYQYMF